MKTMHKKAETIRIEVLGAGCEKCETIFDSARKAVAKLELDAEVVKVDDIEEIIKRGVMMTPALMIDGKLVSFGRVLQTEDVEEFLGGI